MKIVKDFIWHWFKRLIIPLGLILYFGINWWLAERKIYKLEGDVEFYKEQFETCIDIRQSLGMQLPDEGG